MPQPKKQMTSTRSGNRRSQIHLKEVTLVSCKKCKSLILQHEICKVCGYYNEKKVLDMDKKENKTQIETEKNLEVK